MNSPAFVSSSVLLREPDQAISNVLTRAATRTGATAGTTIHSISRRLFLLYQRGRDSRIFQAQDRAIANFTLQGICASII